MNSSSPRNRLTLTTRSTIASLAATSFTVAAALTSPLRAEEDPPPTPKTSVEAVRFLEGFFALPQPKAGLHFHMTPEGAELMKSDKWKRAKQLVSAADSSVMGRVWALYPQMTAEEQEIIAYAFCWDHPPEAFSQQREMLDALKEAKSADAMQAMRIAISYQVATALDRDPNPNHMPFMDALNLKESSLAMDFLLEKLRKIAPAWDGAVPIAPPSPPTLVQGESSRAIWLLDAYLSAPPVDAGHPGRMIWGAWSGYQWTPKWMLATKLAEANDAEALSLLWAAYPGLDAPDQAMLAGVLGSVDPPALQSQVTGLLNALNYSKGYDAYRNLLGLVNWQVLKAMNDPDPAKSKEAIKKAREMVEYRQATADMVQSLARRDQTAFLDRVASTLSPEQSAAALAKAAQAATPAEKADALVTAFLSSEASPLPLEWESDATAAAAWLALQEPARCATLLVGTGDEAALQKLWDLFPTLDWQHQCSLIQAVGAGRRTSSRQAREMSALLPAAKSDAVRQTMSLALSSMLAVQLDMPADGPMAASLATGLKEAKLARPFLLKKLERIAPAAPAAPAAKSEKE